MPGIPGLVITTSDSGRPPVEGAEPPEALARVVNPLIQVLLRSPLHRLFSRHLMLLAFRGRKSGKMYEVVVGRHEVDGALLVPTGTTGRRWRLNFRGGTPVEVTLGGSRRRGRGALIEDAGEVARIHRMLLGRLGLKGARRLGLRVNVDREPDDDELKVLLAGRGVVRIELDCGQPLDFGACRERVNGESPQNSDRLQ